MSNDPPKPMLQRNRSLRKGSVSTVVKPSNALVSCRADLERIRGPGPVVDCRRAGGSNATALPGLVALVLIRAENKGTNLNGACGPPTRRDII